MADEVDKLDGRPSHEEFKSMELDGRRESGGSTRSILPPLRDNTSKSLAGLTKSNSNAGNSGLVKQGSNGGIGLGGGGGSGGGGSFDGIGGGGGGGKENSLLGSRINTRENTKTEVQSLGMGRKTATLFLSRTHSMMKGRTSSQAVKVSV